mmetsp:Transcript_144752/g.360930  ORF Transcript_144752/g.360930 Transcript_144752/m.360930 type:complete len:286 (+) Transcript_144752:617-1474(+)
MVRAIAVHGLEERNHVVDALLKIWEVLQALPELGNAEKAITVFVQSDEGRRGIQDVGMFRWQLLGDDPDDQLLELTLFQIQGSVPVELADHRPRHRLPHQLQPRIPQQLRRRRPQLGAKLQHGVDDLAGSLRYVLPIQRGELDAPRDDLVDELLLVAEPGERAEAHEQVERDQAHRPNVSPFRQGPRPRVVHQRGHRRTDFSSPDLPLLGGVLHPSSSVRDVRQLLPSSWDRIRNVLSSSGGKFSLKFLKIFGRRAPEAAELFIEVVGLVGHADALAEGWPQHET